MLCLRLRGPGGKMFSAVDQIRSEWGSLISDLAACCRSQPLPRLAKAGPRPLSTFPMDNDLAAVGPGNISSRVRARVHGRGDARRARSGVTGVAGAIGGGDRATFRQPPIASRTVAA